MASRTRKKLVSVRTIKDQVRWGATQKTGDVYERRRRHKNEVFELRQQIERLLVKLSASEKFAQDLVNVQPREVEMLSMRMIGKMPHDDVMRLGLGRYLIDLARVVDRFDEVRTRHEHRAKLDQVRAVAAEVTP